MRWVAGLLFLCVVGSTANLRADEADPADAWEAAKADAVERLETIAKQAQDAKLFGGRDDVWTLLLELDPDHAAARKRLKYKQRDGAWTRGTYKRPKDRGAPEAQEAHDRALADWRAWWQERVLETYEAAASAGNRDVQDRILGLARVLLPDAAALHRLDGEVWHLGRWVLEETRTGLANRERFLEAARKAARAVKAPKSGQLEDVDRGGALSWPRVLQGESVRVVGAVGGDELARHHQIAESAAAVFHAVFGIRAKLPSATGRYGCGFPLYVAAGRESGNRFLAAEPGISERDMEYLKPLVFSHLYGRPGVVVKADSGDFRLEGTSHAAQSLFCGPHLNQWEERHGAWAKEAVVLYLGWLQVRTRLLYTVKDAHGGRYGEGRPGVPKWTERMGDPTADWHALAAEVLRRMKTADVHLVVGKDVNHLDSSDLLAGYGLAVYVIEVHPDRSAAFFRDVSDQKEIDLDAVLEKHVGRDFETLRPHLLRWLSEMGELSAAPREPR